MPVCRYPPGTQANIHLQAVRLPIRQPDGVHWECVYRRRAGELLVRNEAETNEDC
jgi:hypothetical protein